MFSRSQIHARTDVDTAIQTIMQCPLKVHSHFINTPRKSWGVKHKTAMQGVPDPFQQAQCKGLACEAKLLTQNKISIFQILDKNSE